jgi:GrpB-like predicted nucleotidyltransferase (UPF0157 family)/quercetin dioxygenase-like cupin family protein
MWIVRFDEEVSLPVDRFGSRFRLGPLTGDGQVRVQVMHLPPGGVVGRHPAASRQLLAAVAGEGTVTGDGDERRALRPGYAAVWKAGEEHETASDGGLTAVCVEGTFDVLAVSVTGDIVVADYDPAWPDRFAAVRDRVWPAVEGVALRIDHVGSTAVPGLAAKPIIDVDVVVASEDDLRPAIERLAGIGYRWRGDMGVAGRESFRRPGDDDLPEHHLYLVVEDNRAHLDHWLLRDVLRSDDGARDRYAALKRRNAVLADRDIDVYVAAKAELVAELLTRARAERGLPPVTYWQPDVDLPEAKA